MTRDRVRDVVDYGLLGRAVELYRGLGFEQVEVPWRVSDEVKAATTPTESRPMWVDFDARTQSPPSRPRVLVGSAEQGFLAVASRLHNQRRYMAVSPCFRDGEVDDGLHFCDFVKLELWRRVDGSVVGDLHVDVMWTAARQVFEELSGRRDFVVETTKEGFDLTLAGVEIGSYGERRAHVDGAMVHWVYGTGLALPRFSQAIRLAQTEGLT